MRRQAVMAVVCGLAFVVQGNARAGGGDACTYLSGTRISKVLGIAIDTGQHIGPGGALCGWGEPNDPNHSGKHVLLTLYRAVGRISPVERFENGKTPIQGIAKNPVGGVGDDAYFIDTPGFGLGLNVKKSSSAFQVKVYGFSSEQIKAFETTLAQDILARL